MKQITTAEFRKAIELDPTWASKLTEPVEITDYCNIIKSHITHLSPLLHFSGRNKNGNAANFSHCQKLKVAEGTFRGFVNFSGSSIEKIGKLSIRQPDNDGYAALFYGCKHLKVAEGTFPGWVSFENSNIERIENLNITQPNNKGNAASFQECTKLKVAGGTFAGYVNFSGAGIERIDKLIITQPNKKGEIAKFAECEKLTLAKSWLERTDMVIDDELRERSETQLRHEAAARKAMKQPTFEL